MTTRRRTTLRARLVTAAAGALAVMTCTALGTLTPGEAAAPDRVLPGPPDGRIAFSDLATGVIDTVNPDGSGLVQLTPTEPNAVAAAPDWTPDGSHVVYTHVRGSKLRIFEIGADGSDPHIVFRDKKGYLDQLPRVMPDGRSILFNRCRPERIGGCAIARVKLNGRGFHMVTAFANQRLEVSDGAAFASPNGKLIAYDVFNRRGIAAQVWVSRIDGTHARPVTRPAFEANAYSWADAHHLLVTDHWVHFGEGLFRVDIHGGHPKRLVKPAFPHEFFLPYASPSGQSMAFIGDVDFPQLDGEHLYVAASDGTGVTRLDVGTDFAGFPAWGTAPPLPPGRSTSTAQRAPARPHLVAHALRLLVATGSPVGPSARALPR